ncbi:zinc finger protein Xfin isoform X3 [Bombyx mori]|uniref:C2H2-type domain-containing protein n=2 Tax=Bombyx mori TaxID=7091 RepID=A0A8R2DNU8_BOMMO|nr:zinc finger protein Xfin isoform X1 [Bombyx mori]
MANELQPLMLCTENSAGEEVTFRIEPEDDFQSFLDKAKAVLGYDIDINSITQNQPVSLHDSIYQFLANAECNPTRPTYDQGLNSAGLEYILDDGTEIRASQIHFDNEDSVLDLSVEALPFVRFKDDEEDRNDAVFGDTVKYNIVGSPTLRLDQSANLKDFANSLPFRLVRDSTLNLESHYQIYSDVTAMRNFSGAIPSDSYMNTDNSFKRNDSYRQKSDNFAYRDEILDIFKNSPVTSLPCEGYSERKHVRKTDPSRIHKRKSVYEFDGVLINENAREMCTICARKVNKDKAYLFDNEDQKKHRFSPCKKSETQLKIICELCLNEYFKTCRMKGANQFLNADEYLIIKNNQQYIYKKIKEFRFLINKKECKKQNSNTAIDEYVKVEIGSDGEIITKPLEGGPDEVAMMKGGDASESSSEVEIIEQNEPETEIDSIIENLENADDDVKAFLGKYQIDDGVSELKCRFCDTAFPGIPGVIEHGDAHKHEMDSEMVYPCPLCDYGYTHFKWLKGHIMAAHQRRPETGVKIENTNDLNGSEKTENKSPEKSVCETTNTAHQAMQLKTEVKQECLNSSDDEIWIVQTNDAEATSPVRKLIDAVQVVENRDGVTKRKPKCYNCSQLFPTIAALASHSCRRRMRKRKTNCDQVSAHKQMPAKFRKKKSKQADSSQILTCHNCNETFTSKVRLKFHMQFHEATSLMQDGRYKCGDCADVSFANETELFDHVHFQHDKQKRWECPVSDCGKTFHLRATLTKHSRTHTDTRRYVCGTCGKKFLDKQTLDEHGVTHLQIKPFQCHICLKHLTRRSRLRMHIRAHEAELRPRTLLVCRICFRAFRDNEQTEEHLSLYPDCFESHVRETNEAQIPVLSPISEIVSDDPKGTGQSAFSRPIPRQVDDDVSEPLLSGLTEKSRCVIRVVEVEKAFKCEFCEDVFYLEEGLNTHRAIHKGVKNPFVCHICKVSFATYSRCTTHKTTHGFYKRSLTEAKKQGAGVEATANGVLGYGDFPVVKHFLCEDCGRSYLHWTYLQVHRRMKHVNDGSHTCNQCGLTFPNSWSVIYHRKKVHDKIETVIEKQGHKQIYRIQCRDCDVILSNKTALYKHRKKEHCSLSDDGDGEDDLTRQLEHTVNRVQSQQDLRVWSCTACPKRYKVKSELKAHLRTKHPSYIAVIEVAGLQHSPEEVLKLVASNEIPTNRIVEITKLSFPKGVTTIVPNTLRSLALLNSVPKETVTISPSDSNNDEELKNIFINNKAPSILRNVRRPTILQRTEILCNSQEYTNLNNEGTTDIIDDKLQDNASNVNA